MSVAVMPEVDVNESCPEVLVLAVILTGELIVMFPEELIVMFPEELKSPQTTRFAVIVPLPR